VDTTPLVTDGERNTYGKNNDRLALYGSAWYIYHAEPICMTRPG